jgi:hypothetical protein
MALNWLDYGARNYDANGWEGLASLARVQTSSVERGRETRYYISSVKNLRAEQAYDLARGHWGVENKCTGNWT